MEAFNLEEMKKRHARVKLAASSRLAQHRKQYFRLRPGDAAPNAQTLRIQLSLALPASKANTLIIIQEIKKLTNFHR